MPYGTSPKSNANRHGMISAQVWFGHGVVVIFCTSYKSFVENTFKLSSNGRKKYQHEITLPRTLPLCFAQPSASGWYIQHEYACNRNVRIAALYASRTKKQYAPNGVDWTAELSNSKWFTSISTIRTTGVEVTETVRGSWELLSSPATRDIHSRESRRNSSRKHQKRSDRDECDG